MSAQPIVDNLKLAFNSHKTFQVSGFIATSHKSVIYEVSSPQQKFALENGDLIEMKIT